MDLDVTPVPGSPRHSFQELVDVACPDADKDALLDELVAAGSVELVDSATVRCLSRAYVQRGADVNRIERMGRFLGAVADNFTHNLLRNESQPIYFERTVVADLPMSESSRDQLLAEASEKGQVLLTELDTFLTALANEEPTANGKKFGVGVYFFEDQDGGQSTERRIKADQQLNEKRTTTVQEIDVLAAVNRKQ
jgi:hypothetical protein